MKALKETWVAMAWLAIAGTAAAQQPDAFPSRPIHFVVCCTGYTEAVARMIAEEFQEQTKQPVVVEPRPGANGILAADYVAKSASDGYTVLFGTNSTHAANQSLYKKLPYDYLKDFVPVSGISQGTLLLAVRSDLPVKSVAELTALAKKEPGRLNYGAASSSTRAGVELYKMIAGTQITYIPYKTNPQVVTDMLGGRIDMMFNDAGSLLPHVQSGRLRALAVSSSARSPALPEVPTMAEAGVKDYALIFWHGVWAPAGTPQPVVDRLTALFHEALARPGVKAFIATLMATPMPLSSPELLQFSKDEEQKWRQIVVTSGMQVD